jgi:hypothetical protein
MHRPGSLLFAVPALLALALAPVAAGAAANCTGAQVQQLNKCSSIGAENDCARVENCRWCLTQLPALDECTVAGGVCTCAKEKDAGVCSYIGTACRVPALPLAKDGATCFTVEAEYFTDTCPKIEYDRTSSSAPARRGSTALAVAFAAGSMLLAALAL